MKNIILNIDNKYVDYCCVFIISCLKYNEAKFHILHNGLDCKSIEKIKSICEPKGNVSFYQIDSSLFKNMPVSEKWPEAIYYRILISEVLPKDIKRVLYSDCDVMIRGCIDELWETELEGFSVAAVEDVLSPIAPMSEILGCDPYNGYFNSGVMLINLDYWRENNISNKCLDYINDNLNIIKHPDQDALNYVLNNTWKRVHCKWNFLSAYQNLYYDEYHLMADYEKKIKNYPVVIHFSGVKPWSSKCRSIYKYEYFKVITDSELDMVPPKKTYKDIIEFFLVFFLDKINLRKKKVNYFL
jgi:lipopolysaccharide biosynthesis glycosyltransferase